MSSESKRNVYVGHRYVPKIFGLWNKLESYEGLSIVTWEGTSYTSKKHVPAGVDILNEEYWVVTGNYNAQIEEYRKDVRELEEKVERDLKQTMNYFSEFAVNVTSEGFKGDGTQADTKLLNDIIQNVSERGGGTVFFPSRKERYLIYIQEGIIMKSNINLLLDNNAILKATPTGNSNYNVIQCLDIENFTIKGGKIIGERFEHTGEEGQWGMGINVLGCTNYKISDTEINECWGDGIYIGRQSQSPITLSKDGVIERVKFDRNRRQGISIVSAKNLDVLDVVISNVDGHNPRSGIDIEPNNTNDTMENIRIINPTTINCAGYGIVVSQLNMLGSGKEFTVTIENHKDYGSYYGFGLGRAPGILKGLIKNINPEYYNNKDKAIYSRDYHVTASRVEIHSPKIVDAFTDKTEPQISNRYGGMICILRDVNDSMNGTMGNIHIYYPSITDNRNISPTDINIFDEIQSVENISIINPVKLAHNVIKNNTINAKLHIKDENELLVKHLDTNSSIILNNATVYTIIDNGGAPDVYGNVVIGNQLPVGTVLTLKGVYDLTTIGVRTDNDNVIKPYQTETGLLARAFGKGAKLTIKKVDELNWIVTDLIGNWENLNKTV